MSALAALLLAAAGTYALRGLSTFVFQVHALPVSVATILRLAALGVLGSLVAASLPVAPTAGIDGLASMVGVLAAIVTGRRTTNLPLVMCAGVGGYAVADAAMALLR